MLHSLDTTMAIEAHSVPDGAKVEQRVQQRPAKVGKVHHLELNCGTVARTADALSANPFRHLAGIFSRRIFLPSNQQARERKKLAVATGAKKIKQDWAVPTTTSTGDLGVTEKRYVLHKSCQPPLHIVQGQDQHSVK